MEAQRELDRFFAPRRERSFDRDRLLSLARASSVDALWTRLGERPFPAATAAMNPAELDRVAPGESARVLTAAERACQRVVDVLGTGPTALGRPIDWSRDYRAGIAWPKGFGRAIDYVDRDRPSDVKVPWELSRLQWLIPAGQAYLLSGEERYAACVREVLEEWIHANPLAYSVNWACAMEAALRIFTWTWFFHVFAHSSSWSDEAFRVRFLGSLYLHGDFTLRHIEKAEVNGNHYTADLAGLVLAGLFFGEIGDAPRWRETGWTGLVAELPRQVFSDGIDYEASCAYHRLVLELFLWAAMFHRTCGGAVPPEYAERLRRMAGFTAAYSRADGTGPLWGDADDARALPFGGQPIGDHRYLIGVAALAFGDAELARSFSGPRAELAWIFGAAGAETLAGSAAATPRSQAFAHGGVYLMRDAGTHVFIDCGPVGLAGRGGHGHNDALSFEAWLDGAPLVTDCGSYVYTASFEARNRFRSTDCHNTPCVDGEEINRFIHPDDLWQLRDEAKAQCLAWRSDTDGDVFVGTHHGYRRLGIEVRRTIRFDKRARALEIADLLSGEGDHAVAIPLHLAPQVSVDRSRGGLRLHSAGRSFDVIHDAVDGWRVEVEPCAISPSYGVTVPSRRLVWQRSGPLPARLTVTIRPTSPEA